MGHLLARLYGCNPGDLLAGSSMQEQRTIFERELAPIFDKRFVRWLLSQPAALYGLGIPPSQHPLARRSEARRHGARVLGDRVERLACDFDLGENYFASQAFGRRYGTGPDAPLPPYLQRSTTRTSSAAATASGCFTYQWRKISSGIPSAASIASSSWTPRIG